jgi:hypothetical protein
MRGFHMLFGVAGPATVLLQEPDLALGEHTAFFRGFLLQPQQAIDAERKTVTLPDGTHSRRRDTESNEPQLEAEAHITVGGELLGHLEDLGFDLRRRLIRHPGLAPRLRGQAFGAVFLVGGLDFVELALADAGAFAGQADVVQFLGQGQHAEAGLDKLLFGTHGVCPFGVKLSRRKPKIYHRKHPHGDRRRMGREGRA